MILFLIDPGKQLNKAKDAQRKEDFRNIRSALDAYYNDFNCYPVTIPFGNEWKVNSTIYMKEIPYDANYTYVVDPSASCPQWNVLFGRLVIAPPATLPACLLESDCLPLNYGESGYNLCDYGGNIDCSTLQVVELPALEQPPQQPTATPTPTQVPGPPTSTPPPGATPTPTPTSGPLPTGSVYYCSCGQDHQTACVLTDNPPINVQYYFNPQCSGACGQPC